MQVRHLLHAAEVNKAWSARDSDSPPISDEDRDMLWSSIGELQKVNQKLMSDLRSVKANHQQIIQEANQAEQVLPFFLPTSSSGTKSQL